MIHISYVLLVSGLLKPKPRKATKSKPVPAAKAAA